VFHHYVGLPLTEVADRLDIPLGTAKSRLHHATNALRASLEADARVPSSSRGEVA
jgi:DNA-directed RNA polymerase specialized sigma24 family protein